MKNRPEIIAIEGSSFTGKTTLCKTLVDRFDFGFIPEYYFFAGKKFPDYPFTDIRAARDNVDFFATLETARKLELEKTPAASGKIVVDRTFLSIAGFQYLASLRQQEGSSALGYAQEKIDSLLTNNSIIIPDRLVILSIDRVLFETRVKLRGKAIYEILNDFDNIGLYASYLQNQKHLPGGNVSRIDLTSETIQDQIHSLIETLND